MKSQNVVEAEIATERKKRRRKMLNGSVFKLVCWSNHTNTNLSASNKASSGKGGVAVNASASSVGHGKQH